MCDGKMDSQTPFYETNEYAQTRTKHMTPEQFIVEIDLPFNVFNVSLCLYLSTEFDIILGNQKNEAPYPCSQILISAPKSVYTETVINVKSYPI